MKIEKEVQDMIVYGHLDEYEIIKNIFEGLSGFSYSEKSGTLKKVNREISEILSLANIYGFEGNLWKNFIAWLIINDENSFSLSCEMRESEKGTLRQFALSDMEIIRYMFFYDFSESEVKLATNVFSLMENYSVTNNQRETNLKYIGERAQELAKELDKTNSTECFLSKVTDFYQKYGVGIFGLNKGFYCDCEKGEIKFIPMTDFAKVNLSDLWGYEEQKMELKENTEAFVSGKGANNVLLYGDSGTGKSTSVKAILNEYHKKGLRIVSVYKYQFKYIQNMIEILKKRNYSFILYMDDLSFEEFETEYKYLKAVIEGGLEPRPRNVAIYATSNRRNLIKEVWSDRTDVTNDIHHSETAEEKVSLSSRFGVRINFSKPAKDDFNNIVRHLAKSNNVEIAEEELLALANTWSMQHNGMSGRVAQQFIDNLLGTI